MIRITINKEIFLEENIIFRFPFGVITNREGNGSFLILHFSMEASWGIGFGDFSTNALESTSVRASLPIPTR